MPLKDELVPKPRQKSPNVSSEILEKTTCSSEILEKTKTTFLESFCCLRRLAVQQLRKNQLPGGNTMPLKDELVPKPRQKSPNVSSEILEKQHFWRASVACGGSQSNSFEKISSRGENTMPLKDELVPKPRQKSP